MWDKFERDISYSSFFSRCMEDLTPVPLEKYDILIAEHSANDKAGEGGHLPELYPTAGVAREQLFRRVLSINPQIAILLPEMWLRIVRKIGMDLIMEGCENQTNGIEDKANQELAKHYQIPAVVKFNHVVCENFSTFQTLTYDEKLKIVKSYNAWKDSGPDSHPSEVIHRMMGEFLLFFFQRSLDDFLNAKTKQQIAQTFRLPEPFYKETIAFDTDFDSQCRLIIKVGSQMKYIPRADNLNKASQNGTYQFKGGFRPATRKFKNQPFQVGMSIFVRLNGSYPVLETNVEAMFKFNNDSKSIGPINFLMPLPSVGYNFRIVQKLFFTNSSQKIQLQFTGREEIVLSSLEVKIVNLEQYPFVFEVVIVEYEKINKTGDD